MLTPKNIERLYQEGMTLRLSRKKVHPLLKGEYDPGTIEVVIYQRNIVSPRDQDLTILHECIHARDDVASARRKDEREEVVIEKEAHATYCHRPTVLRLIKKLYNL